MGVLFVNLFDRPGKSGRARRTAVRLRLSMSCRTFRGFSLPIRPKDAMPTEPGPTRAECAGALTPEYLRITRMVSLALMGGPLVCGVGLWAFFFTSGAHPAAPGAGALHTMETLSMTHVGFTIVAYLLAPFLFNRVLNATRLDPGQDAATPRELATQALLLLRTAIIVRLAVLEGAAIFGLSVCVIGVTGGVMESEPLYWLNLGSGVLLIAFGVITFPSREGLLEILDAHFNTSA
jgi:hypothetical protein